jgi:hypothetical protein
MLFGAAADNTNVDGFAVRADAAARTASRAVDVFDSLRGYTSGGWILQPIRLSFPSVYASSFLLRLFPWSRADYQLLNAVVSPLAHSNLAARISRSVSVDLKSNSNLSEAPGAAWLAMRFAAASAASSVEKLAMVCPSRNR